MKGLGSSVPCIIAAALLLGVPAAHAQRPICRDLAPGETVQPVCAPFSLYPAVRFLADFTVDHLFKPVPPPFQRSAVELGQLVVGKQVADNAAFKQFLSSLPPLRFLQLDRSTGTVIADFSVSTREFRGRMTGMEGEPTLTLRLPETLQGGYWRGPDTLQIAFWKNQRVSIGTEYAGGRAFDEEVECLALSPDGLLLRFTSPEAKPLLVRFRECDQ